MSFPDDIAAELPAPRDDEPDSLRRDIVDELTDHLQCAFNRELLAGPAREPRDTVIAHTAWQQVLARFGPPAQIARQLWLDAMKERIMAQKFTAIMAAVSAGACILMCAFLWQVSLRQSHLQSRLDEEKALNASLMADLRSMLEQSSTAAANAGWAPVLVHLQSADGTPVAGRVQIQGTAINAGNDNQVNVSRTADESGIADFGLLPFGNYDLEVVASALGVEHRESIMLSPNSPAELAMVCPTTLPPETEVAFEIDVPEPLHADRLVFTAYFQRSSLETSSGSWHVEDRSQRSFGILFDADGRVLGEAIDMTTIEVPRLAPSAAISFGAMGGFGSTANRSYEAPIECHLGPARPVHAGDQCVGIMIAARLSSTSGDDSVLPLFFAPVVYSAEVVGAQFFEDSDPAEERTHLRFELPESVWMEVVTALRRHDEAAEATIPDGWQVVQVPTDIRNLLASASGRERFSRGASRTRSDRSDPAYPVQLRVMVSLPQVLNPQTGETDRLPLGVGVTMQPSSDDLRNALARTRPDDQGTRSIGLLVDDELAGAIELARKLGTLETDYVPREEAPAADDSGVNQKTLGILQELERANRE